MVGRTKSVSVLCVINVPRNDHNCVVRALMFAPRTGFRRVRFLNDLVWSSPSRNGAQETSRRCEGSAPISEVS